MLSQKEMEKEHRNFAIAAVVILFLSIMFYCLEGYCDLMTAKIDNAIKWICEVKAPAPRHKVMRNASYRAEIVEATNKAALTHGIPHLFLTAVMYRESSFRTDAYDETDGALGLMQCHGVCARGCDFSTVDGQIDCGAKWLRSRADKCGDLWGGFALYASGKTCKPKSKRLNDVVKSRFKLWHELEQVTQ